MFEKVLRLDLFVKLLIVIFSLGGIIISITKTLAMFDWIYAVLTSFLPLFSAIWGYVDELSEDGDNGGKRRKAKKWFTLVVALLAVVYALVVNEPFGVVGFQLLVFASLLAHVIFRRGGRMETAFVPKSERTSAEETYYEGRPAGFPPPPPLGP